MKNVIALLLLLPAAAGAVPFSPFSSLNFDVTPAELSRRCADAKKRAESALAAIAALPASARTFDNTPWALDRAVFDLSDESASDTFLEQVSVSSSVREAGNQCNVLLSQFGVDVYSREDLYKALKDYAAKNEPLKGEDARLLEKTLLDYKRAGLELPPAKRAEVTAIRKALAKLEADFGKNINESNDVVLMSKDQLDGVPENLVSHLEKAGDKYKVGVDYPTYFPFMDNGRDPAARKALEERFNNRAFLKNESLFQNALQLRLKAAQLLGYKDHADYATELSMAKNEKTVDAFIARLTAKLKPHGQEELEVLAAFKRAMEGRASDGIIHYYDWRFYDNLLKKTKYQVDSEAVREYFPADLVITQMLEVYQKMLGLKFEEITDAVKWHPDVKLYQITDAAGGPVIGYFYMDLFPRAGKYSHAAAFNMVTERRLLDGTYRKPVSSIVANFDKPSPERPSLLDHDEVETIFHEFGHIMHQTLTKTQYGRFSGSNTARDFVEAPSQMLENWVWDAEVLNSLSGYYKDRTKKLPKELLAKMLAAKNADVALFNLRQLTFGTVDMAYHAANPPSDAAKTYARVQKETSLIPMSDGTHPEASFGHLMGGYDAGYYGYLWSKVYAQDMFSVFKAQGLLNPAVGRKYRTEILEKGSARDEMDSIKAFLGREPNEDAFLEDIGLKKKS